MFETVLIANRGEIACRVMRTCQKLGVRTVAVFSEADRDAPFVRMADQAVFIGASPPKESYLRAERILEVALRTGAEAIHPGYGFLSENAAFAQAVSQAGLTFIGPPPGAIRAMGLKDAAKGLMEKAGVPVVPGYHEVDQNPTTLKAAAERIGFPVLIKAVAGGGGKGMRRVDRLSDFDGALAGAQREAENAFGDARVLIEKYLVKPRHIEVQVFADAFGNALHLFERDCSLQRRHQKVLEEAPAPGMPEAMRKAMGEAAVRAAKAIAYQGAGTVEFIADVEHGLSADRFYFMEMNTRLQVEHPVTELITGLDLVEWQLRVAAGQRLAFEQHEVPLCGHAIEARIYAEDPARDYLPQTGKLVHLSLPEPSSHVRIDSGVVEGDTVSVFYDPMIAKLVVWDVDRAAALRRLRRALESCEVAGVTTNLPLLASVARHAAFARGEVHTGFLSEHAEGLKLRDVGRERELLVLACVAMLEQRQRAPRPPGDPYSPWNDTRAFRVNEPGTDLLRIQKGEEELDVTVRFLPGRLVLGMPHGEVEVEGERLEGEFVSCVANGERMTGRYLEHGRRSFVVAQGSTLELQKIIGEYDSDDVGQGGAIRAPMPGKVTAVLVEAGARVQRGQPLIRLEAMKMEHTLHADCDGAILSVSIRAQEQVEEGSTLLVLSAGALEEEKQS